MTKNIVRIEKQSNFVVMDKGFLKDKKISLKAKGLLAYMLSLPDDWTFYLDELEKHSTDGISSLRSGFKELQTNGYVTRKRERQSDGTFKWITTVHEISTCENPQVENPQVENRTLLNNDELNNNKQSSSSAFKFYENNFGVLSPFVAENIEHWINDLNEQLVIEAMKRALKNQKKFNYAEGILKSWLNENITTIEQVEAKEVDFENKHNKRRQPRTIERVDF